MQSRGEMKKNILRRFDVEQTHNICVCVDAVAVAEFECNGRRETVVSCIEPSPAYFQQEHSSRTRRPDARVMLVLQVVGVECATITEALVNIMTGDSRLKIQCNHN